MTLLQAGSSYSSRADKRVFALVTASSIFESMMYLFVFFWSAAIVSARKSAGSDDAPPFGLIFACFMCGMMAGSMIFNGSTSRGVADTSSLLQTTLAIASTALLSAIVLMSHEYLVFWMFCLVEVCVGMYYPSMNFLKSNIIEDASRAKIYNFMRIPLSVFVITAHSFAEEGEFPSTSFASAKTLTDRVQAIIIGIMYSLYSEERYWERFLSRSGSWRRKGVLRLRDG
jgi:MFS transporter, MFS domain-containing protein family, molybdate-anion transporter